MSDSVTNVQIEDVLSSIRKLVSEEVRAQTREARTRDQEPPLSRAVGETPPTSATGTPLSSDPVTGEDRLLLTPALRVPPTAANTTEEAPFVHAEQPAEEADLLDLMARVRAAGTQQTTSRQPRPQGIAPVQRAEPDTAEEAPAEDMVRATLFGLDDKLTASAAPETTGHDEDDAGASLAHDLDDADMASRLGAMDTLAFSGRDDLVSDTDHATAESTFDNNVPEFLHRNGITSLGQRIAEVEAVVSTSGGEWEPEFGEEGEAAPDPEASSLPWDDPVAEDETDVAAFDITLDAEDDDWSVAPDPREKNFHEAPDNLTDSTDADVAEVVPMADKIALHLSLADDEPMAFASKRPAVEFEDTFGDEVIGSYDDALNPEELRNHDAEMLALAGDETLQEADDFSTQDEGEPEAGFVHVADNGAYEELGATQSEPRDLHPEPVVAATVEEVEPYEDDLYDERQDLAADDPTLIDEEMLRDLVSEIVRQELQGALGERITRNVRKLVRREIHRALSAQDLG